jgi:undecaprenyl diphosphate synthase
MTTKEMPTWTHRLDPVNMPKHVALIMDGNGRWAKKRGMPRILGHQPGVEALKKAIAFALDINLPYLSAWAFSTANWKRPETEVTGLMNLLRITLSKDLEAFHQQNIKLRVIGSKIGLANDLLDMIQKAENLTRHNTRLTLLINFNYDGRTDILESVKALAEKVSAGTLAPQEITEDLFSAHTMTTGIPDPDLLIRTGGVLRLSNYMMWQCIFTEFVFLEKHWPDFTQEDFCQAIENFQQCGRNFGQISA